ncbi:N-acetylmuramoyl-L-alanine amidase CwlD [Halanaerocella petrolearia]
MIIQLRKWKIYLVLIIIYLFFFAPYQIKFTNRIITSPLSSPRVIVIDPGHGGIDGGTSHSNLLEKEINLEVGLTLKDYLESKDSIKVIMTREEDTALDHLNNYSSSRHTRDLRARIDIINQEDVDLFISLHVDHRIGQPKMRGPVVLYYPRHSQTKVLATTLQKYLNKIEYENLSSTYHQPKKRSDLYVLKAKNTPGVIIEVGFITNTMDQRLLQQKDYQQALARAIYKGLEEYFSGFKFLTK